MKNDNSVENKKEHKLRTIFLVTLILGGFSTAFSTGRWTNDTKIQHVTSMSDGTIYVGTLPYPSSYCNHSNKGKYGNFILSRDTDGIYKDKLSILLTAKTTGNSVDIYWDDQGSTTAPCVIKEIQINEN